jgi:LacI family transcriptional regulator
MPRVTMVMSYDRPYDQAVLAGVRRYAHAVGWALRLLRIGHVLRPDDLAGLQADGLILRGASLESVGGLHIPLVHVGFTRLKHVNLVTADDYAAAGDAARHLIDQRLGQLLFFYRGDMPQSAFRWRGFLAVARREGVPCRMFLRGPRTLARGKWQLDDQLADLADLLRELPKPIGLLASDDTHGERAVQACRLAKLTVPDDVAIVVHSADAQFCEMADPPLSSIAADPARVGHEAARLLDRLLQGQVQGPIRLRLSSEPIVVRASSNFIAVSDPLVDAALRLIRDNVADMKEVSELVARLPTSRPTLERRFRKALGRSPAEAMRQSRLHLTKQMLRETDRPLADLAAHTGFGGIWQLCRQIKEDTGLTPTAYRRQFR